MHRFSSLVDEPRPMRALIFCCALWLTGCSHAVSPQIKALDGSIQRALAFLVRAQAPSGAWTSQQYQVYKDGFSLTPIVAMALHRAGLEAGAVGRGLSFMATMTDKDRDALIFPIYSLSAAAIAAGKGKLSDECVDYLRSRQLAEDLEWRPTDLAYGSWGEATSPYRRPTGKQAPDETQIGNLSNTLFALEALQAAGLDSKDPLVVKALGFVKLCQNFGPGKDGGFFFCPTHPNRNKAGDFRSYGSTTADGIRALLAAGVPVQDSRVQAARQWLLTNWSAVQNPGEFPAQREKLRNALYFYYVWSAAQALQLSGAPGEDPAWARDLADELVRRQQPDGSFTNEVKTMTENDPLVATPMALGAMVCARQALAGR